MSTRFDPKETLEHNPHLDPALLEKAEGDRRQLEESDVPRKGYRLLPPFGTRRAFTSPHPRADPRAGRLRRSVGG